ncbi:hydantoinase/oxoprolinase N-terminal domain-containing protein [Streptomyces sp. NPDC013187]|uniref:hydantoinase/oxoprolinase N-terminal domain-containing protein n=1 Tax=Streptomyces sp. NPDC013187 TaxID=3364865 RepID=UPI0036A1F1C6
MTGRQVWVDSGGTFTDVVARRPDGRLLTHKLLSDDPARYADAAVEGVHTLLLITRGIRDALRIAYRNRPHIVARRIDLPEPLYQRAVEVVFTHSHLHPAHEHSVGEPAARTGSPQHGSDSANLVSGDVLVIETPGGGGYGPPSPDPHQAGEEIDDLRAF